MYRHIFHISLTWTFLFAVLGASAVPHARAIQTSTAVVAASSAAVVDPSLQIPQRIDITPDIYMIVYFDPMAKINPSFNWLRFFNGAETYFQRQAALRPSTAQLTGREDFPLRGVLLHVQSPEHDSPPHITYLQSYVLVKKLRLFVEGMRPKVSVGLKFHVYRTTEAGDANIGSGTLGPEGPRETEAETSVVNDF